MGWRVLVLGFASVTGVLLCSPGGGRRQRERPQGLGSVLRPLAPVSSAVRGGLGDHFLDQGVLGLQT